MAEELKVEATATPAEKTEAPKEARPQGDRPRGPRPQGNRPHGDRPHGKGPRGERRPRAEEPKEYEETVVEILEAAKRNTFELHIVKGGTLAHEIIGKFGACQVFLKPAPEGTGIIAGGPVRAILELAGIRNVTSKVYGSRAPINIIRATHNGLSNLKSYKSVQALRAKAE